MRKIIFTLLMIASFSAFAGKPVEPITLTDCNVNTVKGHYRFQNIRELGTYVFEDGVYRFYGARLPFGSFDVTGTYSMSPQVSTCAIVLSKQSWQLKPTRILLSNIRSKKGDLTAFSGITERGSMERILGVVVE